MVYCPHEKRGERSLCIYMQLSLLYEALKFAVELVRHPVHAESAHPISPIYLLKPRFPNNSEICLLYSHKQQQIFNTCRWQYHIRSQRTDYPSRTVESNSLR